MREGKREREREGGKVQMQTSHKNKLFCKRSLFYNLLKIELKLLSVELNPSHSIAVLSIASGSEAAPCEPILHVMG